MLKHIDSMTYRPENWQSTDPLGRALHYVRMSGVVYCYSELTAPWGVEMPVMDDCLMFHVVTSGRCWLSVPGSEPQQMHAGDFALVPRGQGHKLLAEKRSASVPFFDLQREHHGDRFEVLRHGGGGSPATVICGAVRFEDAMARQLVSSLPQQIVIAANTTANWDWLATSLRLLSSEARERKPGGEAVITRLADILVIQAIRAWIAEDPAARTGWLGALQDKQLGQALVLMHEKPEQPWTLASLANEVAMSRSAFAARFSEHVGVPAMQYLANLRMTIAKLRLESEAPKLVELAQSLGYESEAAFSRAFKKWSGVAPGSISRQARSAPP
jgi:AraC-like DNA-binding protein